MSSTDNGVHNQLLCCFTSTRAETTVSFLPLFLAVASLKMERLLAAYSYHMLATSSWLYGTGKQVAGHFFDPST